MRSAPAARRSAALTASAIMMNSIVSVLTCSVSVSPLPGGLVMMLMRAAFTDQRAASSAARCGPTAATGFSALRFWTAYGQRHRINDTGNLSDFWKT